MTDRPRIPPRLAITSSVVLAVMAFFGVNRVGDLSLAPGTHTGFKSQVQAGPPTRLSLEAGGSKNLSCYIRLTIVSSPSDTARLIASLPGQKLEVIEERRLHPGRIVRIIQADSTRRAFESFVWPSGAQLVLGSSDPELSRLHLLNWEVRPSDADWDSRSRSVQRSVVLWVSLLLVVALAVVGALAALEPPPEAGPITVQGVVEQQILSVEAADATDTRLIRPALRSVAIEGASVTEAIGAIPVKPDWRKHRLWFEARDALRARLKNFQDMLAEYGRRLG